MAVPVRPAPVVSFTMELAQGWYIVVGAEYLIPLVTIGGKRLDVGAKLITYDAASREGTFEIRGRGAEELGRLLGL